MEKGRGSEFSSFFVDVINERHFIYDVHFNKTLSNIHDGTFSENN